MTVVRRAPADYFSTHARRGLQSPGADVHAAVPRGAAQIGRARDPGADHARRRLAPAVRLACGRGRRISGQRHRAGHANSPARALVGRGDCGRFRARGGCNFSCRRFGVARASFRRDRRRSRACVLPAIRKAHRFNEARDDSKAQTALLALRLSLCAAWCCSRLDFGVLCATRGLGREYFMLAAMLSIRRGGESACPKSITAGSCSRLFIALSAIPTERRRLFGTA